VILTHAHLDHSGMLPRLVASGFRGTVYCTHGTLSLCNVLLRDSGHLQEEDAAFANRHGFSKHKPALPLYTVLDAETCLRQFCGVDYRRATEVVPGVRVEFRPAGHLLGSSFVRIATAEGVITFTGDLGRPHDPILNAPDKPDFTDYLVTESTYGDRTHPAIDPELELLNWLKPACDRNAVVVIPAFAVGRTQALLWLIARLKARNAIPDVPVFMDSPMAIDATALYHRFRTEHRLSEEECRRMCGAAEITATPEASKALDRRTGPLIILSASGMATGGRVVHHLKAFIGDERNLILLTGFQAGGTRGAALGRRCGYGPHPRPGISGARADRASCARRRRTRMPPSSSTGCADFRSRQAPCSSPTASPVRATPCASASSTICDGPRSCRSTGQFTISLQVPWLERRPRPAHGAHACAHRHLSGTGRLHERRLRGVSIRRLRGTSARVGEHCRPADHCDFDVVTGADWLPPDCAALSEAAWQRLQPQPNETATFSHADSPESARLIRSKVYGEVLDRSAFRLIMRDAINGVLADVEIASFLTACAARPMSSSEITALTLAMVDAGTRLDWGARNVLDKHCIGGLAGNRTTPIVVAIVAACGGLIPKTSSRAITSPAGTADAMETLAPVALNLAATRAVVEREGGCIVWGGSVGLSPADDVLIRTERVLDFDSDAQLVASVLSKKLAAGSTSVLLDLPVGPSAKLRSDRAAKQLGENLTAVGAAVGLHVRLHVSDGTQPVGRGIGPALEARDVIDVLACSPAAPRDLRDRALDLAALLLEINGARAGTGRMQATQVLDDGARAAKV
jgi:putative thymidine phosphorylase